ncbi:MAG: DNA translocase FtsK 4TM domain-containing protein, partial [Actinomycetota bacterium]|nr:DNA translocase FtsK 4TM domain-containing protein [Actinomycetota bacterium]
MASRSPASSGSPPRSRSGARGGASAGPAARRSSSSGATRMRSGTSRSPRGRGRPAAGWNGTGPAPGLLLRALGRLLRALWLGLATIAGALVRGLGRSARHLDPEHRRDGAGLGLLGLALVVAAVEWWGLGGPLARVVHAVVAGTVGLVALVVPLLLAWLGVRLLRRPEHAAPPGPLAIGLGALLLGLAGVVHITRGLPAPPEGVERMQQAGGVLGYLASSPLAAAVTAWVAVPLLLLLVGFGLLVVTATPLHAVPARVAEVRGRLFAPVRRAGDGSGAGDGAAADPGP